ncbi:tetratricopeptide repeat protein [Limnoraphis robusta Tam1]|uniref:tetratricopeptide repeat protein n=1 Tax=Limnoraphis robusta TaxID=1118279 RepID=UPI002B21CAD9|nr:tetratricopeptide repeat protein [Limnoraphis robusta]MEA5539153.1 tetratricopeptide repeat protein [Limnoraphis robusta Tam1]
MRHPPEILAKMGLKCHQKGQFETAVYYYQQALIQKPHWPEIYYNQGLVLYKLEDLPRAIESYQKAIEQNPNYLQAYYNLGVALQHSGQIDAAINIYKKMINIPAENKTKKADYFLVNAYNNLGYLFASTNQVKSAIYTLKVALDKFNNESIIQNNLGQIFLEIGELKQAIYHFKQAIMLDSENYIFHQNIGKAFQLLNLHQDAIESFKRAIQLQPDSIFAESSLGESLLFVGELKSAIAFWKSAVKQSDFLIDYYCSFAQSLIGKDELEKAIIACANFLTSLKLDTDFSQIVASLSPTYISLGNVLIASGKYAQAELYYHKSLHIYPQGNEASLNLKLCLEKQAKWNSAKIIKQLFLVANQEFKAFQKSIENHSSIQVDKNLKVSNIKDEFSKGTSKPCEGLNCQSCLKKIFSKFQIQSLSQDVYFCQFPDTIEIQNDPIKVSRFFQGRAWVSPQKNSWLVCEQITIWNSKNKIIPELSRSYPGKLPFCEKTHNVQDYSLIPDELPNLELIEGTVAVLSGLSGNVYFHWMVDILPRFDILRNGGYSWDQIDWFVVNSIQQPFQRETLERLGIPLSKIIESDRSPYIEAEKLIVPSFPSHLGWLSSEALAFHRSLFLTPKTQNQSHSPTRIYISRERASYRHIINEAEVMSWLSQWGFVRVELESLSVEQQVTLFANAEIIVSAHGSGLTNIMFCCPGTTVIELVSPHYIRHYYWVISQQLKLQHFYIKGSEFGCYPVRQLMYPNPLTEDILISLKSLEKVMKIAGILQSQTQISLPSTSKQPMSLNQKISYSIPQVTTSGIEPSTQSGLFLNSEDQDIYLHGAEALYTQKKYQQAAAACQRVISITPNAKAYKILGNIQQIKGQFEKAKDSYAKAIQLQPDFAEVFCNLGTLYAQEQDWQPAIICYQRAITLEPKLAIAYRNLARAWTQLGKKEEAAECWYHAYSINPGAISSEEHLQLANMLLNMGLVERAIASYCHAIQSNSYSQESYKKLGKALKRKMELSQTALDYQNMIALKALGSLPEQKLEEGVKNENSLSVNPARKSIKGLRGFLNHVFSAWSFEPELSSAFLEATLPTRGKNNHTIFTVSSLTEVDSVPQNQELKSNPLHDMSNRALSGNELKSSQYLTGVKEQSLSYQTSDKLTVKQYIKQAEAAAQLGNLTGAIEACQEALKIQPNTAVAYKILGEIEQALGHRESAQGLYKKAIEFGWKDAEIYLNLGTLCAQQQNWKDSIKYYQESIKINPKSAVVYHNLSKVWKQLNKPLEMAGCLYEAYSLEPERGTAKEHLNLGNILLKQDQITPAITCYKRAIQMDSKLTAAYQNISEALKRQGKRDEAEFYLQKLEQLHHPTISIKKDNQPGSNFHHLFNTHNGHRSSEFDNITPLQPIPLNGYSNGHLKLESKPSNITTLPQTLEKVEIVATEKYNKTYQNVDIDLKEAEESLKNKQFEKAINACQRAVKIQPNSAIAYKLWGNALQCLGRVQEAKEQYNHALVIDPKFAEVHANLGSLYAKDQQWDAAISCYQKAIQIKPKLASAYRNLAKVWKQLEKSEEWANCWYRALTLEPEGVTAEEYIQFANALIELGKVDWTVICYKKAIQLDPRQVEAYLNLGEIFISQQQLENAIAIYNQAIEHHPQKPEFYCKLGQVLVQLERWEEAITAYNQALALNPNLALIYHNLGEVFVSKAQFEQAIDCYKQLIQLEPDNWEAYHKLGDLFQEIGQLDEAVEAYHQAIELTETEPSSVKNIEV